MHAAYARWSSLGRPWQQAFDAAWASFGCGSGAVGAVITDSDGAIVAVGQNRMLDPPGGPGPLSGTLMAHAEMNALAGLPPGEYSGHTTLRRLAQDGASAADVAHVLWAGLCRVSRADA